MIVTRRSIIAPLVLFALSGCGTKEIPAIVETIQEPAQPAPAIQQLNVTVLHKADFNFDDSQTRKEFKVLATEAGYFTELARHSVEVPKPIDFSTSRVFASTMGTQSSGGFVISVVRAEEFDEKVVVTVELSSPGASCITTLASSNPYEFVVIPTVKTIEFIESEVVAECTSQVSLKTGA